MLLRKIFYFICKHKLIQIITIFLWLILSFDSLDKNCGKNQEFPFHLNVNVVLGHVAHGAWGQQHWNWGKGVFLGVGCVMQKNNVFAKIFCSGLFENFRDLAIILSKIVRKCYQSFTSPFEHKEFHILKQTEFNCVAVTWPFNLLRNKFYQCLPFDSAQLKIL